MITLYRLWGPKTGQFCNESGRIRLLTPVLRLHFVVRRRGQCIDNSWKMLDQVTEQSSHADHADYMSLTVDNRNLAKLAAGHQRNRLPYAVAHPDCHRLLDHDR